MLSPLDYILLVTYFAATLGIGFYFYARKKSRSIEGYTAANRSLPGWVCGLSILATYVSSISYLALPGAAFSGNWNPFVFSLSIPLVAVIAVYVFLPYYRKSGAVSAYELLETRFGTWARVFTSSFYLIFHIARIAVVLYLMALPMQVIFGWNIYTILLVTGACVTLYSLAGGLVAVIWTDAIQAIVLIGGAIICLFIMLGQIPGGASEVIAVASEHDKFSLGSFDAGDFLNSTFWVVLLFGIVDNLRNFGIDQSYIQRYIAAKSDADARRSLWLGALLYVPISALFFFIGTTLFVAYGASGENPKNAKIPTPSSSAPAVSETDDLAAVRNIVAKQKLLQEGIAPNNPNFASLQSNKAAALTDQQIGDRVFPHFIANHLPTGLTGLLIAAIFAAAMSTVSTSLNSSATLLMNDFYKRFLRPAASERSQMNALYAGTILWGILGTGLALFLVKVTNSALDIWWALSGIIGGGMTGLFLLGMINKRAGNPAAITGTLAGVVTIGWIAWPKFAGVFGWESQPILHERMAPVIGVLVILVAGTVVSLFVPRSNGNEPNYP